MSHRLGCGEKGDKFAAIAPVSGGFCTLIVTLLTYSSGVLAQPLIGKGFTCSPKRFMPVLRILTKGMEWVQ